MSLKWTHCLFLAVLTTLALSAPSSTAAASFVYISVAGQQKIAVYTMDEASGALKHARDIAVSGGPGSLAVDPQQKYLFASIRSAGNLASFRIDPHTGSLTLVSEISAGADPAFVSTDRTGRFLLSAYYQAGKIAVHAIAADGSLGAAPLQSIPTAEKAHCILTDAANKFAYVPHTGPNAIFQFAFNDETGMLAPADPPKIATPEGYGPRHIWLHPRLAIAYVDNEQGSSLTAYRRDETNGALAALQTLSTVPADFSGNNSCADLEVHPSGRFAYVSNRGHDSIAAFEIDPASGKLAALGQTPTEQTPRSFNIDRSGRFLYAAGQSSGKVAAYRIDAESGGLTRFATYEVGAQPWWVLAATFVE